jgi:hypothetical protein
MLARDPTLPVPPDNEYTYVGGNPALYRDPSGLTRREFTVIDWGPHNDWANWSAFAVGLVDSVRTLTAGSVKEAVAKLKEAVGEPIDKTGECGNCIEYLRFIGHGVGGVMAVGSGTLYPAHRMPRSEITYGTISLGSEHFQPEVYNAMTDLAGLMCENSHVELMGCYVGFGSGGRVLLPRLANMLGATVSAPTGLYIAALDMHWGGGRWVHARPGDPLSSITNPSQSTLREGRARSPSDIYADPVPGIPYGFAG